MLCYSECQPAGEFNTFFNLAAANNLTCNDSNLGEHWFLFILCLLVKTGKKICFPT